MTNCKAALTLAAVLFAAPVHALTIDAVSVTGSDPITFSVTFNAVPDLNGPDEFGWAVTTSLSANPWAQPEVEFVCGAGFGHMLVRNGATGDSIGVLPYALSGRTVLFESPSSWIGDAQFRWRLGVAVYGALSDNEMGYGGLIDPHTVVPVARTSWGGVKAVYAGR